MVKNYSEKDLEECYQSGYKEGVEDIKRKLVDCANNGKPIEIDGKAYFIKNDIANLREIFADLESEE